MTQRDLPRLLPVATLLALVLFLAARLAGR